MKKLLTEHGLPEKELYGCMGIDAEYCKKLWINSGSEPEHLADFLMVYPAGYYITWVQSVIGKWYAEKMTTGEDKKIKLLEPGSIEGFKKDSGLTQLVIDYEIYLDANRLCKKGYKIEKTCYDDSVFSKMEKIPTLRWKKFFAGKKSHNEIKKIPIAGKTIMHRYSRFKRFWEKSNSKAYPFRKVVFVDNANLICGPTILDNYDGEITGIGFWIVNNEKGFTDFKGYVMSLPL